MRSIVRRPLIGGHVDHFEEPFYGLFEPIYPALKGRRETVGLDQLLVQLLQQIGLRHVSKLEVGHPFFIVHARSLPAMFFGDKQPKSLGGLAPFLKRRQIWNRTMATATKRKAAKKKPAKKTTSKAKGGREVDSHCPIASQAKVHEDWDAMLNQTNIANNNNKFYVIQVLEKGKDFYCWTRWGRVGEHGQNALRGPFKASSAAISEFEKKFQSKTSNKWANRANFQPKSGKYELIEIEQKSDDEAEEVEEKLKKLDASRPIAKKKQIVAPSKHSKEVQALINLIFDHNMFKGAMASFDIDVKKMPLGQLSKKQVTKGFEVLDDLEKALKKRDQSKLMEHSSHFYTVIPHAFGRQRPPVIDADDKLQKKRDMLNVLADIEVALNMQKKSSKQSTKTTTLPNPIDLHYDELNAGLELVKPGTKEHDALKTYLDNTKRGGWRKSDLIHIYRLDRNGEDKRYGTHDKLGNRKLLWHGTNVAVVAAIIKSGLRIMPHSGGRVGRGIYLASEQSKSAGYVGTAGNIGIMFLAEAALGKEHHITRDNSSLRAAPKGFDSIVAKGYGEPDPKKDTSMKIDGREVVVPQGKVVHNPKFKGKSSFNQSEYLIYKESQVRIRYVLKLRM